MADICKKIPQEKRAFSTTCISAVLKGSFQNYAADLLKKNPTKKMQGLKNKKKISNDTKFWNRIYDFCV